MGPALDLFGDIVDFADEQKPPTPKKRECAVDEAEFTAQDAQASSYSRTMPTHTDQPDPQNRASQGENALVARVKDLHRQHAQREMSSAPDEREARIFEALKKIEQVYGLSAEWVMADLKASDDINDPHLSPSVIARYVETLIEEWPTQALNSAPLAAKVAAAGGSYALRDMQGEVIAHLTGATDSETMRDPDDGKALFTVREVEYIGSADDAMGQDLADCKLRLGARITAFDSVAKQQ